MYMYNEVYCIFITHQFAKILSMITPCFQKIAVKHICTYMNVKPSFLNMRFLSTCKNTFSGVIYNGTFAKKTPNHLFVHL